MEQMLDGADVVHEAEYPPRPRHPLQEWILNSRMIRNYLQWMSVEMIWQENKKTWRGGTSVSLAFSLNFHIGKKIT
ncbi:hypothetical protein VULLAG_LOCUS17114 [Vulpes lagopus]